MGIIAIQNVSLTQLLMQLGMTLLMLALFAALAFLAVKYLKPRLRPEETDCRMRLVSRLSLSPRKQIYLVKVDTRELVLGASDNQLVLLTELAECDKTKNANEQKEASDG